MHFLLPAAAEMSTVTHKNCFFLNSISWGAGACHLNTVTGESITGVTPNAISEWIALCKIKILSSHNQICLFFTYNNNKKYTHHSSFSLVIQDSFIHMQEMLINIEKKSKISLRCLATTGKTFHMLLLSSAASVLITMWWSDPPVLHLSITWPQRTVQTTLQHRVSPESTDHAFLPQKHH